MAVCRTRMEAAALWVKFRAEGLEDIETTDSAGHSLDEHELISPNDVPPDSTPPNDTPAPRG